MKFHISPRKRLVSDRQVSVDLDPNAPNRERACFSWVFVFLARDKYYTRALPSRDLRPERVNQA